MGRLNFICPPVLGVRRVLRVGGQHRRQDVAALEVAGRQGGPLGFGVRERAGAHAGAGEDGAEKSNEITAIPELLDALLLKGCIVTVDAMGCQTTVAAKIVEKESDYVLAVKNNQPTLAWAVEGFFEGAERSGWEGTPHTYAGWVEKDHGRIETRRCWASSELTCLGDATRGRRPRPWRWWRRSAKSAAWSASSGVTTSARCKPMPGEWEWPCRGYWGIENGLHWVLDVAYGEDQARMREGNSTENFSILRRITLTLARQDKSVKAGVKNRRLMTRWDDAYRENF